MASQVDSTSGPTLRSGIYEGLVIHHRHVPVEHRFTYRIALVLLDLSEIDTVCRLHPLWSNERRNVVTFNRADFLGDPDVPLDAAVRDLVEGSTGTRPVGPISVLTQLRTWGWLFNPITTYYCYDDTGTAVTSIVVEVTNTPWHERTAYVLDGTGTHRVAKGMHVSPFLPMDVDYHVTWTTPGEELHLDIEVASHGKTVFSAGLALRRSMLNRRNAIGLLVRHPAIPMRVSLAIYRKAVALFLARVPFYRHPTRSGSPRVSARIRTARAIVTRLLGHLRGGALELEEPSRVAQFGETDRTWPGSSIHARIDIHDARVYERLLREGSIGLGESYADGWWDTDDLASFLRLALRNLRPLGERHDALHRLATPLVDPFARLRRANADRDARHVRTHYDLGNDFFRGVLDETMAYSCAIFDAPGITLTNASTAKFDRLACALDLSPGDHLLAPAGAASPCTRRNATAAS